MKCSLKYAFLFPMYILPANGYANEQTLTAERRNQILGVIGIAIAADNICITALFPKALMQGQESGLSIEDMSGSGRPYINSVANSTQEKYSDSLKTRFCAGVEAQIEEVFSNKVASAKNDQTPAPATASQAIIPVSGFDLRIETNKWTGKKLQTRFNCLYADVNEFRCVASSGVRIDFTHFTNPEFQKSIETNCGTSDGSTSKKCVFDVRYVYEERHVQEMEDGLKVVFVRAINDEGEIVTSGKR